MGLVNVAIAVVIVRLTVIASAVQIVLVNTIKKQSHPYLSTLISTGFTFIENYFNIVHNMITIDISFSKEFELERVLATLKNKKWFDDNNYTVSLPSNLDVESMEATIKEEYEEGAFEKPKNYVESNWGNVGLDFAEIKKTNLPFSQNYVLFLTKYGVAGSYRLPNKIIVNIKFKYEFGLIRTIIHEMIHLAIEEYVIQYKVNHWAKEQIVNLLTFKIAPKYAKVSNAKVSDQRIDDVFNSSYPDVGKIIKSVGELTSLST